MATDPTPEEKLADMPLAYRRHIGDILAAAQGVDIHTGSTDDTTRMYWYRRADQAITALEGFKAKDRHCQCVRCKAQRASEALHGGTP